MTKREQQEKLFRAIGFVGDDLLARADAPVEPKKVNTQWVKWAALAACCLLVIGLASRLPLFGGKTESTAPETAAMTMDSSAAATEETVESPASGEPEEATEETAAEEAPAEEDAKTGGSSSGSRNETSADSSVDEALQQELLDTTLGPVKLGMPSSDVLALLGQPKETSGEWYVCTDKGDYLYDTWRYNFTNDPNYLNDVELRFADMGNGLVLNDIQTFGTSDWALPSGLKNGSSVQELLAVYPDAEPAINGYDGEVFAYGVEAGHVRLTFLVDDEKITSISLGTYYEEPGWIEETSEEPAYSFASDNITIYQKDSSGWRNHTVTGKNAKRIEVICGIELLAPIDTLPEPAYYLDFQNGTVVMLGPDRISGAVYTCEDLEGFRSAMDKGEDPVPYLTLLEQAKFPYGTDDVIAEMAAIQ